MPAAIVSYSIISYASAAACELLSGGRCGALFSRNQMFSFFHSSHFYVKFSYRYFFTFIHFYTQSIRQISASHFEQGCSMPLV